MNRDLSLEWLIVGKLIVCRLKLGWVDQVHILSHPLILLVRVVADWIAAFSVCKLLMILLVDRHHPLLMLVVEAVVAHFLLSNHVDILILLLRQGMWAAIFESTLLSFLSEFLRSRWHLNLWLQRLKNPLISDRLYYQLICITSDTLNMQLTILQWCSRCLSFGNNFFWHSLVDNFNRLLYWSISFLHCPWTFIHKRVCCLWNWTFAILHW